MAEGFPSLTHVPSAFPLPTIAEDTLHYVLHLPSTRSNNSDAGTTPTATSSGSSADAAAADAAALATLITAHVHSLLPQPWLWNKDAWELKVGNASKLEGTMRVGDAVDDEWLVVWLLREVSRKWPEIVMSIRDSDGEFLLIEAAHELPDWVSPENAENRLWMSGGHLHLLPLSVRSSPSSRPQQIADDAYDRSGRAADTDAWVSEPDALAAVATGKYRAPADMEAAVWDRIACYPAALATHQHHAKAYLPEKVARALYEAPELIQRAVEGFYVRDPAQLRAAARMTHFPPSPAILSSVLLTRAAYAQLQGQVFHPPRVFGPEWHVRDGEGHAAERRWRDLGVKIATGFEIMYREGGRKGRAADAETSPGQLAQDPAYQKYISDLRAAGFFGSEMQGSAAWQTREAEAAKGWVAARSSDTTQQRPSFAYLVDKAVAASASVPAAALAADPAAPEHSDKWLEVDPDELDAMMARAAGAKSAAQGAQGAPVDLGDEHGQALHDLASKVEEFVGGQGDMQGARFADELSDEDMDSDSDNDSDDDKPTEAERQERMAKLVPSLPAEEWGRKTQTQVAAPDVEMEDADRGATSADKGKVKGKGTVAGTAYGDSLLPPKMRPPRFAKQEYDGVVSESSDEDDDEDDLPPQGTLGRKIAQMKWGDGASPPREAHIQEISDNDEDADDEDKADRQRAKELKFDDDIDELMRQRVWGGGDGDGDDQVVQKGQADDGEEEGEDGDDGNDMDVDMGDEYDDFLKFSREALGISDSQWEDILASRRERGAFVPEPSKAKAKAPAKGGPGKTVSIAEAASTSEEPAPRQPNMALNSFESMMAAMDGELARHKASLAAGNKPAEAAKPTFTRPAKSASANTAATKASKAKGKNGGGRGKGKGKLTSLASLPTEADLDAMDDDELAAMDAELRSALAGAGDMDFADDDVPEAAELGEDQQREYHMMRDLLESFKSQGGESGVVGNLFGRLGEQGKSSSGGGGGSQKE